MSFPWALVDIGGTKTRLSVSEDGKTFTDPTIFATPQNYDQAISLISKTMLDIAHGALGRAMVGIAGPLNLDRSGIVFAPNLPEWNNKPLQKDLADNFRCPVSLENDTAVVGLGEAVDGAGKGYDLVAYITVSTGFNGSRIVNGQIDANFFGFEIGSQIVSWQNFPSGGDLEELVSSGGILRATGKNPQEIGNPTFWKERTQALAVGVYNTALYWSPEVIVVGGGLAYKYDLKEIEALLRGFKNELPAFPQIVGASLGDMGGLYGAMRLLQTTDA